jgi:hypothetical protein
MAASALGTITKMTWTAWTSKPQNRSFVSGTTSNTTLLAAHNVTSFTERNTEVLPQRITRARDSSILKYTTEHGSCGRLFLATRSFRYTHTCNLQMGNNLITYMQVGVAMRLFSITSHMKTNTKGIEVVLEDKIRGTLIYIENIIKKFILKTQISV